MGVVLLVRHGQASFGADDYDVLSATGLEQGRLLGRALAAQAVVAGSVVHGAMRRQVDSAAAIVDAAGWSAPLTLDEGWNEFDHRAVVARHLGTAGSGAEGGNAPALEAYQRTFDEATARWTAGNHDDEYDEAWPAFLDRTRGALDRAFARDGVTVVVSSGGPIAAVCAALVDQQADDHGVAHLWRAFNTVTVNTSVTRVIEGPAGRRLLTFNEHSHLPRALVTYR